MDFQYGNDTSSKYYFDYKPAPEPVINPLPIYGMSSTIKNVYYGLSALTAALTIVVCAGQIWTKTQCRSFRTAKAESTARSFEILAGITLALAVIVLCYSIYALVTQMGRGHLSRGVAKSDLVKYDDPWRSDSLTSFQNA